MIFYAQEVVKGLNEITNSDFLRENLNRDGPDGYLAKNLFALCFKRANSKALAQAQVYVQQKNYAQALQCYADALQKGPLSVSDEEQVAWAIFHNIKALLKDPKRNFSFISNCFSLFFRLTQLKKPSLVNSLMLCYADLLAMQNERFQYAEFMAAFDLKTLRCEDYEPSEPQVLRDPKRPMVFEALYYKALRHSAKNTILRMYRNEVMDNASLDYCCKIFLEECEAYIKLLNTNPSLAQNDANKNRLWIILYTAKILLKRGQKEQGISLGLQIVKSKASEYWAWHLLARMYSGEDDFKALCCWCKTFNCKPPASPAMQAEFASYLHTLGEDVWAAFEIKATRTLIENTGLKDPALLKQLENSTWYQEALLEPNFKNYTKEKVATNYDRYANEAEELIYSSLPWFKAIVGKKITIEKEQGKKVKRELYLFLEEGKNKLPVQLKVPSKKLAEFIDKSLVWVRVLPEKPKLTDKIELISVKDATGETWELPCKCAVISHVNQEKKIYTCVIIRGLSSFFPSSMVKKELKVGDEVGVVLCAQKPKPQESLSFKKEEVCKVLKVISPQEKAASELKKHSKTTISTVLNSGNAFTEDDIFIPQDLVNKADLKDGDEVEVDAVLNFNPARSEWSYRAYKVIKTKSYNLDL